ncbi:MAG: tetratricopeptide repeat protein [Gammaproteobacteria bacterium]|nr:tetratricopeptide repeat protein [Gammaproteobacteria bacterium]
MIDTVNSPYILAAEDATFQSRVVDNSLQGPVLVNFWSRKAGPCLRQYPILDQLIHHYGGRLLLVNVDTETEIIVTKEYAVTSVPVLKLFRHGRVVETWRGYQAEADLRKVLDRYVARDSDRALSEAVRDYAEGRTQAAFTGLAQAIVDDPENPRLPVAMCKLLRHEQRYDEALSVLASLPDALRGLEEVTQLEASLVFASEADMDHDIAGIESQLVAMPANLDLRRQLVAHYVVEQQYEPALQTLLSMMEMDMRYADDYPRRAMLRIFDLLGQQHPLVSRYRSQLVRYTH